MKNLILILAITFAFSCNKNSNKSNGNAVAPMTATVYCLSTDDGGVHKKLGCVDTREEATEKAKYYRDKGYITFNMVEKPTCSDCN